MRRREFITLLGGAAVAWPISARAQQAALPVVGWLDSSSLEARREWLAAFHAGLRETGYREGENLVFVYNYAEDQYDRLPALTSDLVRRRVAVIVAAGAAPALAAKAATATIPVVFASSVDPIAVGLVSRLNRPSGNLTGATLLADAYYAKGIALMHELVPEASTFSFLMNPTNLLNRAVVEREIANSARALGLRLAPLNASNPAEVEQAFSTLARERTGGLIVNTDTFLGGHSDQIIALAARYRVPAIYPSREKVQAGGLMSYGGRVDEMYQIAGRYTGRILKGEKPGDLPVVQATKFELAINLKTARALGITVPLPLLAAADEVIE
jgi:putative ABC transport system substrate-binding protein